MSDDNQTTDVQIHFLGKKWTIYKYTDGTRHGVYVDYPEESMEIDEFIETISAIRDQLRTITSNNTNNTKDGEQ